MAQALEAASNAAVDQQVAEPHDESAQQAGIDVEVELDTAVRGTRQPLLERADLVGFERQRAGDGRAGDPLTLVVEAAEFCREARAAPGSGRAGA